MEQEVCRVPPRVAAVELLPVLRVVLPLRLLIPRRQVRTHPAVWGEVVLVRREGHPAVAVDQGIIGLPTFRTRLVG